MHKKSIIAAILTGMIILSGTNIYAAKDKTKPAPDKPQSTSEHTRPDPAEIKKKIDSALDDLVRSKTITESQKDAIIKDMKEKREEFMERKENKENINGKVKDRKNNDDTKGKEPKDGKGSKGQKDGNDNCKDGKCGHKGKNGFLSDLVENGTITQRQADAVREAIKEAVGFERKK
jgi:hypothetical protein